MNSTDVLLQDQVCHNLNHNHNHNHNLNHNHNQLVDVITTKQHAVMVVVFPVHIFAMVKMIVVTTVTKAVDVSKRCSNQYLFFEIILSIYLSIYLADGRGGKETFVFAICGGQ